MSFLNLHRGSGYSFRDPARRKHNYVRIVDPATAPVTLTEAKTYCRVDDTADDTLLTSLINVATSMVEEYLDRSIITQTWKMYLDYYPWDYYIVLPRGHLLSVVSFKTYDDLDVATTWDASNYYVDTEYDRLVIRENASWPDFDRDANGIEVIFTAGYGPAATDVPEPIRQAILMIVTNLYEHRDTTEPMSDVIQTMLQPYRKVWL